MCHLVGRGRVRAIDRPIGNAPRTANNARSRHRGGFFFLRRETPRWLVVVVVVCGARNPLVDEGTGSETGGVSALWEACPQARV